MEGLFRGGLRFHKFRVVKLGEQGVGLRWIALSGVEV